VTESVSAAIWVIGILAWFFIRYPYQRRARKQKVVRNQYDYEERILISGAVFGLFLIPIFYLTTGFPKFADYPFRSAMGWAGGGVMALFLLVFIQSHRNLGRNFSVTLKIRETHTLVTDGIYRYVRHPMYSSFWLWAIGQALLFPNWIVGGAGLLAIAFLYFRRIRREEQMMLETFGDEYAAYCNRTARLIPRVY
jgi:protein-S-isoprenylcysteine O-methyltransferase Ste14